MAKTKFKKPPPPNRSNGAGWHLLKTAAKSLFALALAFGVLAGFVGLGQRAGTDVVPNARYTVAFADIETTSPSGQDRKTFLTEVRFLSDLPETLQSVDPKLAEHLRAAFNKHPWVLGVDEVAVTPTGQIRVGLKFREPVLAMRIGGDPNPRAIDRHGVLLPANASTAMLPVLIDPRVPMGISAGQKWPDPDVQRAVELVLIYPCQKIERVLLGWVITQADGRVRRIIAP